MSETANVTPSSIRRLETANAKRLVTLVEAFEDLQTVLWCCERLVPLLADTRGELDDLGIEAMWSLAMLSYARAFAEHDGGAAVTEDDLVDPKADGEVQRWHKVLLHLRGQLADATKNPRETYTVGLAQDEDGAVNAVAVTSVRAPGVDEAAVRQAGAMAFPLCELLDGRINELQKTILDEVRDTPKSELDAMDLIEVVATG
jgi:hypothetical protein